MFTPLLYSTCWAGSLFIATWCMFLIDYLHYHHYHLILFIPWFTPPASILWIDGIHTLLEFKMQTQLRGSQPRSDIPYRFWRRDVRSLLFIHDYDFEELYTSLLNFKIFAGPYICVFSKLQYLSHSFWEWYREALPNGQQSKCSLLG